MNKITISATEAKTKFAELIDSARIEPVTITRNNRPVAVVLSPENFSILLAKNDAYWGDKAAEAAKSGFIGKKQSADFLSNVLNSKD